MIKLQPITTSDTRLYNFMEQLLIVSFPPEEYRPIDDLRALTDHSAQFRNNVLLDNGMPIGLLTYWDFGDYCYVEHFATSQELRNKGYGKQSLECLHNTLRRPIVLEVECPTNELAQRRINFYAKALSITPQYLATILKQVTGMSTNQWMHVMIIEKAKHLLLSENKNIQEVAKMLNYPDQSTFGKMFKSETGMSPIQFKKEITSL